MDASQWAARCRPCPDYRASLGALTRADLWPAAGLVLASFADSFAWGRWWQSHPDATDGDVLARGFGDVAVLLGVVALILAVRRQPWRTVGFGTALLGRSLRVGVALAVVILGVCWAAGAAYGGPATDPRVLTYGVPHLLVTVGFFEELLWRGFVTTRLAAAFRRQWVGVVLAGALFGLDHVVASLAYGGDVGAVLAANWWRAVIPFGEHFALWWLYARYDSLAAPTLLHLCMNLSGGLLGTMPL